ncbi:MAG: YkgJ family cysteine cluster protein [Bacteroidetes bacterium]|nr:YkgJ family cysteine cluster protein [Bacteroidota bacterium]
MIKQLPELHEDVFSRIDCLSCANCCKNHSPRFKIPDIKRIAKFLGMKEGVLIEKYLRLDEDNDYVLQHQPCTFLGSDNTIPMKMLLKRPALTPKNAEVCPAVFEVMEKLSEGMGG